MNKKLSLLLVLGAFLVFGVAFAAAQGNADKNKTEDATGGKAGGVSNMTYGSCVSEAAKVKNDCYASVKMQRASCLNSTEDKTAAKKCAQDYKSEKKQCKADFKKTKRESCGKIKASFLEKARYAFK